MKRVLSYRTSRGKRETNEQTWRANRSEFRKLTFAGPMIKDEKLRGVEFVAGREAVCSDGNKDEQSSEKKREGGGEALVVVNPREEAIEKEKIHFSCDLINLKTKLSSSSDIRERSSF